MSQGRGRVRNSRRVDAAHPRPPRVALLAATCAMLLPLLAQATEPPTDTASRQASTRGDADATRTRIQTLDEEVVSVSTLTTTAASATQHVTVLRRADLDAMRGLALGDILARQAGVVVDRGARSGGFGSLFLRGADPSHVVVLVDNVRQNDPLSSRGSAVDLNTLSVDDIERVEIVRGNASVVNADAIAGLIHIITRRGENSLGADVGGDGLRTAQAAWGGEHLRFSAARHDDGDGREGGSRTRAVNGAWRYDLGDALRLQFSARHAESALQGFPDDSGGARHAVIRALESRHATSRQLALQADGDVGRSQWQLQLTHIARDGDDRSPGVAPGLRDPFGLPAVDSRSDYRRDDLQVVWRRETDAAVAVTAGALHQRERGLLDSEIDLGFFVLPARFEMRRDTDSLFAEARWTAAAWTVQGGVRHERVDGGDATTHPMLSLQRRLDAGRGAWGASIARSAKQPSFYALGHPLVGDPTLRPEVALHRELYYATAPDADVSMRLTVFSARYRDLIDFEAGPPPRLVNRARIESDGLEWRVGRRFSGDWRLQFEGAWMRVRDPDGEATLRHRPRLQWAASGEWPLGGGRELGVSLRHLDRRFDSSIPTGDRWLPAATVLDLSLRQPLGPVDLRFGVDNALDTEAEEIIGSGVGGRRLRVSLHWRLP